MKEKAKVFGLHGFYIRRFLNFLNGPKRAEKAPRAEKWRLHVRELKAAVERHGWDGDWYRRAYFDDGTPLGSATNKECQIDSIAQSWAVLSGAADPARAARAMAALDQRLDPKARGSGAPLYSAFQSDGAESRAISRATYPACAKMAASIRMPPCGPSSLSPH